MEFTEEMRAQMKGCRLCGSVTSGHKNDLFDAMLRNIEVLAQYVTEKRFNQAGNVLIKQAGELVQTYNGCCTDNESIQKYGDVTINLIKLGKEIARMDKDGELDFK